MEIELELNKLIIHQWAKYTNDTGRVFNCDYWDCPHKIKTGETYYVELYLGGQSHQYCLECSAYFMAQALNALVGDGRVQASVRPVSECPGKPCEGCASEGTC